MVEIFNDIEGRSNTAITRNSEYAQTMSYVSRDIFFPTYPDDGHHENTPSSFYTFEIQITDSFGIPLLFLVDRTYEQFL